MCERSLVHVPCCRTVERVKAAATARHVPTAAARSVKQRMPPAAPSSAAALVQGWSESHLGGRERCDRFAVAVVSSLCSGFAQWNHVRACAPFPRPSFHAPGLKSWTRLDASGGPPRSVRITYVLFAQGRWMEDPRVSRCTAETEGWAGRNHAASSCVRRRGPELGACAVEAWVEGCAPVPMMWGRHAACYTQRVPHDAR